jgi:hypothetical protein
MLPSKSYGRIGRLMMADLDRNTRSYAGRVADVGVFNHGMNRRDFECSS